VDAAVDKMLMAGGSNPRPLQRASLRALLFAACGEGQEDLASVS
jgi:hypothetical protein